MKTNNKNFNDFINFNKVIISKKIIALLTFASIVFIAFQLVKANLFFKVIILFEMLLILSLATVAFFSKHNVASKFNLFCGSCFLSMSISCVIISHTIINSSIVMLLISFLFLIVFNIIYFIVTIKMIKKGTYKEKKSNLNAIYSCSAVGAICGVLFMKVFSKSVSIDISTQIMSVVFLILAFLMSLGNLYLLKFYYQIKYKL